MSPVFGLGLRTDCNRGSLWRRARALFSQMQACLVPCAYQTTSVALTPTCSLLQGYIFGVTKYNEGIYKLHGQRGKGFF